MPLEDARHVLGDLLQATLFLIGVAVPDHVVGAPVSVHVPTSDGLGHTGGGPGRQDYGPFPRRAGMPTPTIGLKMPTVGDRPDAPEGRTAAEWAIHAETLGYDSIWMSEAWGPNAPVELGSAAPQTDEIRLCTAIVNVYSRTPAVIAMAGATLQRLSGGRAVLGVGPSHERSVRSMHGMDYDRPVRRTHEAIELIKELTGGSGEVTYAGEILEVEGVPAMETPVPVHNAALGAANRRATGRVADGWLPFMFPVSALAEAFETIARTAEAADRDPDDIHVTPQILAAASDDPAKAKDVVREFIAGYVGPLPNYRNALADWFPDTAHAIGDAWADGGREAAVGEVTDEVVLELGVAGTPDDVRAQLGEILDRSVIDCPIMYVPRSAPEAMRDRTIAALAPRDL